MKNKILTALLSALIAIGIWTYVVTVVSPNSDAEFNNIPVYVQSEVLLHERGLMITHIDTTEVSLRLEGSRIDLNKLSSTNIGVTVDVSKIYSTGTHSLTYAITYPGDVPQNAVNVLSKNPSSVTVTVEERISKPVPVEILYDGTVAEHFIADKENIVVDHSEINITGPKAVIDQIEMAAIHVDLEGRNESISEQYTISLCDADAQPVDVQLVTTDFAEVNLTLKIMRLKQINLTLNVIDGGGATAQTSVITIDPKTIWISGSDSVLEGMDSFELGTVDLATIAEDTTIKFPIKLPEGIADETGVAEATVDIQFPDLATKTLKVNNIVAVNLPAGMKAELLAKTLEVQIRGPKDKIDALEGDALIAEADFTETELGAVIVKVTITCSDPEFGAVGSYTVSAMVRESGS